VLGYAGRSRAQCSLLPTREQRAIADMGTSDIYAKQHPGTLALFAREVLEWLAASTYPVLSQRD
jgi:hypothetical protein